MKNYFFLMLSAIVCLSCNNESKNVTHSNDTAKIIIKNDTIPVKPKVTHRDQIISEIERFRNAIITKNKAEILNFFDFPLADSTVNFFEVDSIFDAKRKLNNGITKQMFSDSFDKIYEQTDMIELNNLFRYLNTNDLERKDDINYTKKVKNDGCYYLYSITIKGNEIYLHYGTNSSDDYRKAHPDEEEICSEYAQMWTFKFDGKRLKFVKHLIAG